jgi:hypothetical protein
MRYLLVDERGHDGDYDRFREAKGNCGTLFLIELNEWKWNDAVKLMKIVHPYMIVGLQL